MTKLPEFVTNNLYYYYHNSIGFNDAEQPQPTRDVMIARLLMLANWDVSGKRWLNMRRVDLSRYDLKKLLI